MNFHLIPLFRNFNMIFCMEFFIYFINIFDIHFNNLYFFQIYYFNKNGLTGNITDLPIE